VLVDGGLVSCTPPRSARRTRITDQPLASIAKREEWIYVYGQENEPIVLDKFSPVLHLVQQVRDEAIVSPSPSTAPAATPAPPRRTRERPRHRQENVHQAPAPLRQRGTRAPGTDDDLPLSWESPREETPCLRHLIVWALPESRQKQSQIGVAKRNEVAASSDHASIKLKLGINPTSVGGHSLVRVEGSQFDAKPQSA